MVPYDSRIEIWGNELYGPRLEERIRVPNNIDSSIAAWLSEIILIFLNLINLAFSNTIKNIRKLYIYKLLKYQWDSLFRYFQYYLNFP